MALHAKCKNGHPIGVKNTSGGACSAVHCAYDKLKKSVVQQKREATSNMPPVPMDMLEFPPGFKVKRNAAEAAADATEERQRRMDALAEARAERLDQMGLEPKALDVKGADAERLADQILGDGAASAAAELLFLAKYGGEKVRLEAAKDVLDRTGHGKKDQGGVGASPMLILNFNGALPWSRKDLEAAHRVVDAAPKPTVAQTIATRTEEPSDA
jgi:hypothetical protein